MAYKKKDTTNTTDNKKESYIDKVMSYSGKEVKVISCYYSMKEKTFSCKCKIDKDTTYNLYGINASIAVDLALNQNGTIKPFFEIVESGNNKYLNVTEIV